MHLHPETGKPAYQQGKPVLTTFTHRGRVRRQAFPTVQGASR